jgi:hypothetical protein
MVEYVFDIEEGTPEPRPMAVHRVLHQSALQLVVDGVLIEDGKTRVRFSRALRPDELHLLGELMKGPFDARRKKGDRPPPSRQPEMTMQGGTMRPRDKQDIIDAVVDALARESAKTSEQIGEILATLDGLQLQTMPEEPEHLLPIDESVADVDTAGEAHFDEATDSEGLVVTDDVVDAELAGELARLKKLKATKKDE